MVKQVLDVSENTEGLLYLQPCVCFLHCVSSMMIHIVVLVFIHICAGNVVVYGTEFFKSIIVQIFLDRKSVV